MTTWWNKSGRSAVKPVIRNAVLVLVEPQLPVMAMNVNCLNLDFRDVMHANNLFFRD
jgi:hypothetical protein